MNKYEHNWATAAMIQGNLKNFRGRKRHLARIGGDSGARGSDQDDMDVTTGAGDGENATPPPPSPEPSDSESSSDEDEE